MYQDERINVAPEIGWNEIELMEVIGEGHFGVIHRGRCRGLEVAVKILKKKKKISDAVLIDFKKEVNALCSIRSPDVCFLLGACTEPNHFCIVQEFISGGHLGAQLGKSVPFLVRIKWAQDIARGMMWMHGNRILHRDLKLDNLMLTDEKTVKVCDLGLSDIVVGKETRDEDGMKGTPLYAAPEVLREDTISTKADVYSFGIIFWELLFEQRAFASHRKHNDINIFKISIEAGERPPIPPRNRSPDNEEWNNGTLISLMTSCWDPDPSKRPEFKYIHETLDQIIVSGYVKDNWAKNFWLTKFPGKHSVRWVEFVRKLETSEVVTIIKNLEFSQALECLKILLIQFTGNNFFTSVTLEHYGKIFDWFAPGIVFIGSLKSTFLNTILDLCRQKWFYGSIQSEQASQMLQTGKYFLVRIGSIPNTFTLQTQESRSRIYHTEAGFKPDGSEVVYPTLQLLLSDTIMLTFHVCPTPSLFSKLFSNDYKDESIYTPLVHVARTTDDNMKIVTGGFHDQ